jgi:hypothetical protein
LGEHQLDKLGVTGSSPVPPIEKSRVAGLFVDSADDVKFFVTRIFLATVFGEAPCELGGQHELGRLKTAHSRSDGSAIELIFDPEPQLVRLGVTCWSLEAPCLTMSRGTYTTTPSLDPSWP